MAGRKGAENLFGELAKLTPNLTDGGIFEGRSVAEDFCAMPVVTIKRWSIGLDEFDQPFTSRFAQK